MAQGIPLGPYLLIRRLARGGMAEIFLARRDGPEGFSRDLVVKRILPHLSADAEFVEMFLEEARVAARLAHPNVVHVYDFGEVDSQYYLAMELVRGVDLSALILRAAELARAERKLGAIPMHHAAKILSFACEGLAHAHGVHGANKLVHRDITPSNVLISFDGAVKVADFGIAKAEQGVRIESTRQGVVKGKRTYLSPEQSRGERLDARSDLFNIGILLYEAVTGVPVFTGETYREVMRALVAGQLPGERWLADVPEALVRTIRRALSPDPADRHADALELRGELEAFLRTWPDPSDAVEIGAYVRGVFADVVAADRLAPRAAGTVPALTAQFSAERGPAARADVGASRAPAAEPAGAARAAGAPPRGVTQRIDGSGAHVEPDTDPLEHAQTAVRTVPAARHGDATLLPMPRHASTARIPASAPERSQLSIVITAAIAVALVLMAAVGVVAWIALREPAKSIVVVAPPPSPLAPPPSLVTQPPLAQPPSSLATQLPLATPIATVPTTPVPTATRAAAGSARVRVSSTPTGAIVAIDGVSAGATPLDADVAPGEHVVAVSLDGYLDERSAVSLAGPGETGVLVFSMRRAPRNVRPAGTRTPLAAAARTGTLTISTTPWSRVYLGARLLGTTPLANVTLPAGRQTLTLRAPGRTDKRLSVTITPDAETRVRELL